jgi:hypothetical protein
MLQMDEDIGLPSVGEVGADVAVDIDVLKTYLERLLGLLLGADQGDLDSSLFAFPDSLERLRRFASDPQTPALYVLKEAESPSSDSNGCKLDCYTFIFSCRSRRYTMRTRVHCLHVGNSGERACACAEWDPPSVPARSRRYLMTSTFPSRDFCPF